MRFAATFRLLLLAIALLGLAGSSGSYAAAGSAYSRNYVQKAYVAYYGRPADPGGQDYWASRLDEEGGSLNAIIGAFGYSDEFNRRYGGLSYGALVTKIYQQALGRDPDLGGLNWYVNELLAGRRTLQTITLDVLNGATTEPDSIVVANKLLVAAYFTSRVAVGCSYGTEQTGVNTVAGVTDAFATAIAAAAAIDSWCGPRGGISTSQGLWRGRTIFNQSFWGFILDSGSYYFIYSTPGTFLPGGFVQGTLGVANGRDFAIGAGVYPIGLDITYQPRSYVQGSVVELGDTIPFAGLYDPEYEQPASLADAAGTYLSAVATPATGWQEVTVTLLPSGVLFGGASGCTFTGTALPHGSVNVFELTVQFNGGLCVFGTSTLYGIAHYDPLFRGIVGMAPNASRTDGFMFFGLK